MADTGVQSSYSFYPKQAFAGMLVDIGLKFIRSFKNPNVALYIGCLAVRDTNDDEAKHPTQASDITTATTVVGVVAHAHDQESNVDDGLAAHYPVKSVPNILTQGRIWVAVEEAVTPADPVYVRYATGAGGSQNGAFRKSADTATAAQLANARWLNSSANNNGFAQLEIWE